MIDFSNIRGRNAIQSSLSSADSSISTQMKRLSSGQRITSASDDGAGLSVATSLQTRSRVLAQGIRNVNDGISLLSTAAAAVDELTQLLSRQGELANQAASTTLTASQRSALDKEADALTEEFNRIVSSTSFNSISLLSQKDRAITIQSQDGVAGQMQFLLGQGVGQTVGDGSFGTSVSIATAAFSSGMVSEDFNGDGNIDLINITSGTNELYVYMGTGTGTFTGPSTYDIGGGGWDASPGDIDNDGDLDLVAVSNAGDFVVKFNNGSGVFSATATYALTGGVANRTELVDINGDGNLDVHTHDAFTGFSTVSLGNGDGTFGARQTSTISASNSLAFGDFNKDGKLDFAGSAGSGRLYLGNGDGTFQTGLTFGLETYDTIAAGDFNNDGNLDVVGAPGAGYVRVFYGSGTGTFSSPQTLTATGSYAGSLLAKDMNGDNIPDVVVSIETTNQVNVFLSNGDGSFASVRSASTGNTPYQVVAGDFNNDGGMDFATADFGGNSFSFALANTTTNTRTQYLDLTTRESALTSIELVEDSMARIEKERGNIAAAQSRLLSNVSYLTDFRDQLQSSASRIVDVDTAQSVSELIRSQVVSQASQALMASANQSAERVLTLLA